MIHLACGTALAILALTLALDNRIRLESAALAAPHRQLAEHEEPLAHELRGEMEELQGTVAGQQATLAELYEVLLEPPEQTKPDQNPTPGVGGATTGKNATTNTAGNTSVADGTADWGTLSGNVRNLAGLRFIKRMDQIEREIDEIDKNFGQADIKPRSNDTTTINMTSGGLADWTLPEHAQLDRRELSQVDAADAGRDRRHQER